MNDILRRAWARVWTWRPLTQAIAALTWNSWFTRTVTKGIPCLALNCYSCPLSATACPVGSVQYFVELKQVPWYVLGVVGLAGALGGRFACGWLCPFGWLQELLFKIPVPKWQVRPRRPAQWWVLTPVTLAYLAAAWVARDALMHGPLLLALYLAMGTFIYALLGVGQIFTLIGLVLIVPMISREPWFCKLCPAGMLEGGIPWTLIDVRLRNMIGGLYWFKLAVLIVLLAWMTVTSRPFCRWLCPLGATWSYFNRWSTLQMAVDHEACIDCDRCRSVCPVDIGIHEDPNAATCIRCMQCVDVCPVSCISVRMT